MEQLLTDVFMEGFESQPAHMTELGAFTASRTYTRWLESEERRESWKEAVRRAVEYNLSQHQKHMAKHNLPYNSDMLRLEAETLFKNIFNLKQFLSGRTHWVGGADSSVADKFPTANFNCSFIAITSFRDLSDLFYMLMVGTGVGLRSTKEMARGCGSIRDNFTVVHKTYEPLPANHRQEHTTIEWNKDGEDYSNLTITVGDSKEGWVEALTDFFIILTDSYMSPVTNITFNYDSVRPKGERLKTFGGTASGHEPLQEMFSAFEQVIKGTLDPSLEKPERAERNRVYLRPIHFLDIANLIGNNVVVGGVRRTAEIFLCDADDWESITAKYGINGIWDEAKHKQVLQDIGMAGCPHHIVEELGKLEPFNPNARPMGHRRMSNNSVAFTKKPEREQLHAMFSLMQTEGEPGFINLEEANRRRPNANGINPCAEILLDSYGVCNLTTVNVRAFVIETEDGYELDFQGLAEAQALSARSGLRMTLVDLELPTWDAVHKRDRLIGTSLTGWKDAMAVLDYTKEQENQLLNLLEQIVNEEALSYAIQLRIPVPLASTTIKPEGTLSQVAGGVSSGLHHSHAPYFIRRIRINADDALVGLAKELNWQMHPEVGNDPDNPKIMVIDFPVKSGAKKTKDDVYIDEQFDTYFDFQNHYTQHNSSITIHVRPDEWEIAEERVWNGWNNFVGVSFLAYDGGTYQLAPYEAITEEEYNALKRRMFPFSYDKLVAYERGGVSEDLMDEGCINGACGVR